MSSRESKVPDSPRAIRPGTDAPLLFVGLNEVNFEFVQAYVALGELPQFGRLIADHGFARTTSETRYEELEPWIQWVTAHTGLSFAEHGVFRLGDIVKSDLPQIWERLESMGYRVGAVSPMNAKMRLRDPAFFVPDPWTPTEVVAPELLRRLFQAVSHVVNENATGRFGWGSMLNLALGVARVAAPRHYALYLRYAARSIREIWFRPIFLDLLLTDLFELCVRRTRPHFASLFLNAGAHIQHHYMFSSRCYQGELRNPGWYIQPGKDPLLDVYRLYDRVLGGLQARFPLSRLVLATGLHQDAHPEVTFYWRLRDHAEFLRQVGVPFRSVEPRMSRDFVVACSDAQEAEAAARRLCAARDEHGTPLFEVDNRGSDLFVMLTYAQDIPAGTRYRIDNDLYPDLRQHVAFVAIKNGQHNGEGYYVDTGAPRVTDRPGARDVFPLCEIPARLVDALTSAGALGKS